MRFVLPATCHISGFCWAPARPGQDDVADDKLVYYRDAVVCRQSRWYMSVVPLNVGQWLLYPVGFDYPKALQM